VHCVAFLVTDGDNLQWALGDFPDYFNHPARGSFSMGWALPPSLADLAPSALQWFYANASNGLAKDFFVAGPSALGYMYPSRYPLAIWSVTPGASTTSRPGPICASRR